jgi:alpha,alpha-trehalase
MGKGAWNQRQHDVWGMILDAVDVQFRRNASQIEMPLWEGLAGFVQAALEHWREPDQGLREVRGAPKHFTASKVMCWVAASRGADLARQRGDDERAKRWQAGAEEIRAEVLEKGVSERGVFRQHYQTGETGRARALCQKLLSFAGPLLLYAEEIDPATGEHLGNFPQAFTHLALIEAVSLLIASELEQDVKSAGWDPAASTQARPG